MKLLLCHFSTTGNTARVARAVGNEFSRLGMELETRDITPLSGRQKEIDRET
jgi:flavodoxin